jgi:hypothetical protein
MDERRRFAVALAGVMGSIGLAAGIALTGPGLRTVAPQTRPATMAALRALPALSMPEWDADADVADAFVVRARREPLKVAAIVPAASHVPVGPVQPEVVRAVEPTPAHVATGPAPLQATARVVVLTDAPHARGASALGPAERRSNRGPVVSAFVVAGTEVGSSFKTVGRTIKRLF